MIIFILIGSRACPTYIPKATSLNGAGNFNSKVSGSPIYNNDDYIYMFPFFFSFSGSIFQWTPRIVRFIYFTKILV